MPGSGLKVWERRIGIEGQQQEAEMRELRAGFDRQAAEIRVLSQSASEQQADLQVRDHEVFEVKELIFNLGVDMDEIRKELERTQEVPGREIPDISKYQEQLGTFRYDLGKALQQVREGDQRFSQLQQEFRDCTREPQPEGHQGISEEFQRGLEDRLAKIEGRLTRQQQQTSSWQEDSVKDFQAVEAYMDRVRKMVQEIQQTEGLLSTPKQPRLTKLTVAAMKGDLRVEVAAPDAFRVGEVVVLGEREAKMVVGKGSLIFRFPIEGNYPGRDCGTTVSR